MLAGRSSNSISNASHTIGQIRPETFDSFFVVLPFLASEGNRLRHAVSPSRQVLKFPSKLDRRSRQLNHYGRGSGGFDVDEPPLIGFSTANFCRPDCSRLKRTR